MKRKLFSLAVIASPLLAFANATVGVGTGQVTSASSLIDVLQSIVNKVAPFLIGLAVLFFIYALFQFITSAGDEEARAGAKQLIIWSVITLFVMISIWGLVNILKGTFNLQNTVDIPNQTNIIPR